MSKEDDRTGLCTLRELAKYIIDDGMKYPAVELYFEDDKGRKINVEVEVTVTRVK